MITGFFTLKQSTPFMQNTRIIIVPAGNYPVYDESKYYAVKFPKVGIFRFPKTVNISPLCQKE